MTWMHYNPHRADPALLDRITSGEARVQLRDGLLATIRDSAKRRSMQHQLLIGARGAGKTHLLRVVAYRVGVTPALRKLWWPVTLPEEQGIRGPHELFAAFVARIAADLEKPENTAGIEAATLHAAKAASAEARQAIGKTRGELAMRLGYDGLKKISAALGRKILAVVENLDALFYRGVSGGRKEADTEQWGLRRCLQEADFLLLLGAAPTYFGAASDPGAAFQGFFQEHRLEALALDEVIHIAREHMAWLAKDGDNARSKRAADLLTRFHENKGRLAGMLRITGGLPRFAHLIVNLLIDSEDADSEAQLERLLDEQTPYFQGRLDPRLIPASELEALATIARASGPLRPSELARRLGVPTGEASVLLERLRERGLARKSGVLGNAVAWDVAEPLYRVWMAFREGGEPKAVMVALTEMVAALYSVDELAERAAATRGTEGQTESVWGLALTRGPMTTERESLAEQEEEFQKAQRALDAAEAEGKVDAETLIAYVDAARRTGRDALGESKVDAMIAAAGANRSQRARALFAASWFFGPNGAARAAAAAAIFEELGASEEAFWAKGQQGQALQHSGQREEARELLQSTYRAAVAHKLPGESLSWLALLVARCAPSVDARREWCERALEHAELGTIEQANAWRHLGILAATKEARLRFNNESNTLYRSLGHFGDLGHGLLRRCDMYTESRELGLAAGALMEAVDLFLERDALFSFDPWARLHDFAVWGTRPIALSAFRELAACVNHDTVRKSAEPWLLLAAINLIAQRTHTPADTVEILEIVRDDLTRDRRHLVENVVLAARLEAEAPEAVLFEHSEPLREVVAEVSRRVLAAREKPARARPPWAPPPSKRPAET